MKTKNIVATINKGVGVTQNIISAFKPTPQLPKEEGYKLDAADKGTIMVVLVALAAVIWFLIKRK